MTCPKGKKQVCACRKPRGVKAGSKRQLRLEAQAFRVYAADQFKKDKAAGVIPKKMSLKQYIKSLEK
jgi:hypothetical protein